MTEWLLRISAALFALTGIGYLFVPGAMLGVVGVSSVPTSDFLIRTEGVALLCAAGVIWGARRAPSSGLRIVLISLATYYLISSVVDLVAFANGVVGALSVPSAIGRTLLGSVCLVAAWKQRSVTGGG